MSDLVQAILIPKGDHIHEDVVVAVATASVKALVFTRQFPIWDEWLAGPFTKTVRRATITQFDDATEYAVAAAQEGDTQVIATAPMRYEDFPKCIAKAQVQGTDYPHRGSYLWPPILSDDEPLVAINPRVEMTTGKTAAQVAHGLMAAILRRDPEWIKGWVERQCPWGCFVAPTVSEFDSWATNSPVHINDAGYTEVEPGTLTVVAS